MSTNGETADLMVREGIQITESALKLAGLGAKNLAALLIALANDNQKLAGKAHLQRLRHAGEEQALCSGTQDGSTALPRNWDSYPTMRSCTSPVNPAHTSTIWTRRPSTRDTAHPM